MPASKKATSTAMSAALLFPFALVRAAFRLVGDDASDVVVRTLVVGATVVGCVVAVVLVVGATVVVGAPVVDGAVGRVVDPGGEVVGEGTVPCGGVDEGPAVRTTIVPDMPWPFGPPWIEQ
jgi:hypothetical protein